MDVVLGSLATVLGVVTVKAWKRGVKGLFGGWGASARWSLPACLLVFLATGGYIFKRMHGPGGYQSNAAAMAWMVDYEQSIQPLNPDHLPDITFVETDVQLYPATGRYSVAGRYTICNNTAVPIDTLLLGVSPEVSSWQFRVENADVLREDLRLLVRCLKLRQPLRPGDSMYVGFKLEADRSGFIPYNSEHAVARNGSYIELDKQLPYFGYNPGYALDDRHDRMRNGLPAVAVVPSPDSAYRRVRYHTTITTDVDQRALAPGRLWRSSESNGRATFEYRTSGPTPEGLAISSARYAEKTIQAGRHALTVYYHPSHSANLPAMLDGVRAAMEYCEANYALYPEQALILAEIPVYPGAATAYPGIMFAKEAVLFTADYTDTSRVNHAFATAAHETAHQWWAHMLTP